MPRSDLVRTAIGLSALMAGGALMWVAAGGSSMEGSFPGGGYNVIVSLHSIIFGLAGATAAIAGLMLLTRKRPQA